MPENQLADHPAFKACDEVLDEMARELDGDRPHWRDLEEAVKRMRTRWAGADSVQEEKLEELVGKWRYECAQGHGSNGKPEVAAAYEDCAEALEELVDT